MYILVKHVFIVRGYFTSRFLLALRMTVMQPLIMTATKRK